MEPGYTVNKREDGLITFGNENSFVNAQTATGVDIGAEVVASNIGRTFLPKFITNLRVSEPQIGQLKASNVLSFATMTYQGAFVSSQQTIPVEGILFVAIRQDRTAILFIGTYVEGKWEQVGQDFGKMFYSMITNP